MRRHDLTPSQIAETLCKHQLLPEPVVGRLSNSWRLSDLIRQEDIDFLNRAPYSPLTDLDKAGLYAALSRFVECEVVREVDHGDGQAVVSVRSTRPHFEAASLRTRQRWSGRGSAQWCSGGPLAVSAVSGFVPV